MTSVEKLLQQGEGREFRDILFEKGFPINLSLLEFIKFQLKYIIPVPLSEGELTLLAYVHLYDSNYAAKFITDGHSRSSKSVDNYVGKLRKEGILTHDKKLNPQIALTQDPTKFLYFFDLT